MSAQATSRAEGHASSVHDDSDGMFLPARAKASHLKDTAGVDPTVNLAADYYDSFKEGYGTLHDARKVSENADLSPSPDQDV